MNKLGALLQELEARISEQETVNFTVSKVSVGWHIEHTLLTINLIIERLKNSNPDEYKWTFNVTRILVFATNKIPRGRAQSPKVVIPAEGFTAETLRDHINLAKKQLIALNLIQKNNYFEHPYFGKLNLKSTAKFLEIHTKHHLDIINDIIKMPS